MKRIPNLKISWGFSLSFGGRVIVVKFFLLIILTLLLISCGSDSSGGLEIGGDPDNPYLTWNDNTEEYLSDVPDWVAENVDEHLTEVEEEKNYEQRNK